MVGCCVFLKDISASSSEESLSNYFSKWGFVRKVAISIKNGNKDRSAVVTFSEDQFAKNAISYAGGQHYIDRKCINVREYIERPPLNQLNGNFSISDRKIVRESSCVDSRLPLKAIQSSFYLRPHQYREHPQAVDGRVLNPRKKQHGEVVRHPNIFCSYCGFTELASLAYCPQENCKKWFCNGTSVFYKRKSLEKSHIILHACLSKHTSFNIIHFGLLQLPILCSCCGAVHSMFQRPASCQILAMPETDAIINRCSFIPKCNKCTQTNIFEIGIEDVDEAGLDFSKMWCRKHATEGDQIAKELWNPIVVNNKTCDYVPIGEQFFIRIISSLMKPVSKKDMLAHKGLSDYLWGLDVIDRHNAELLEEFWRWNPQGIKEEFLERQAVIKRLYTSRKNTFEDVDDYVDFWTDLVHEFSQQEQHEINSLPPITSITKIIWLNVWDIEVTLPFGIFTNYLEMGRPLEVADVRIGKFEDLEIWHRDASISSVSHGITESIVTIHLLEKVFRSEQVTETLRITLQYNDINFWRMEQAMYKFKKDSMSVSPNVRAALLGLESVDLELNTDKNNSIDESATESVQSVMMAVEQEDDDASSRTSLSEMTEVSLEDMPPTINSTNRRRDRHPFYLEYETTGHKFSNYPFMHLFSARRGIYVLNDKQKEAVRMALQYPVVCIQGPPGTGKTQTAAAIIGNFLQDKGKKILCCAPSNVAIDHLMVKLLEMGKNIRILRLFAHTRDIRSMDIRVQQYTVPAYYKRRPPLKRSQNPTSKELRDFERCLLETVDVVCTTCNSAGIHSLKEIPFPYVLIDEAAQATEPDCLIPITRGCEKLVLIGDHKQLGAVIQFPNLQKSQLSDSLLLRLWNGGLVRRITLTVQYRMHPDLCSMVSRVTYDGQLENDSSVENRPPASPFLDELFNRFGSGDTKIRIGKPMLFIDISKTDELSGIGTSFVNVWEGHFITRLVTNILENGDLLPKFGEEPSKPNPTQIGIITFYKGQKTHLNTQFHHDRHLLCYNRYLEVEVQSVDGFQGREKDIIILSCVKSDTKCLGFTDDEQRLNVAMSRARKALIVVGDLLVFQKSEIWTKYLVDFRKVSHAAFCEGLPIACNTRTTCNLCARTA